jgi:hypothetical protein
LTVSEIQVSKAPRKYLEVPSLKISEKLFETSNLYRLCIQFVRRAVKGNQAYSGEYSFTLGLTHRSTLSPRSYLSDPLFTAPLSLPLPTAPASLSILHRRRRRSSLTPVTVLLVRPACKAGHPSSSVAREAEEGGGAIYGG